MLEDFKALLAADSGVSAKVAGRIYPGTLEENVDLPAIRYQLISSPQDHRLEDGAPTYPKQARVQVDCYGANYSATDALADAVKAALDGYSGNVGNTGFQAILKDNELDNFEAERRQHCRVLDFVVLYQELS